MINNKTKLKFTSLRLSIIISVFLGILSLPIFFHVDRSFSGVLEQYLPQEEEIDFIVGELKFITVYSPTRVSVVDPLIADIDKVTEEEIAVIAKSPGTTTLTVWDRAGKRTILLRVFAEDIVKLKDRLFKLLSRLKISNLEVIASKEEGRVIVLGEVLPDEEDRLELILEPFIDKIINLIVVKEETTLVEIETQILELTLTAVEQLGIDWINDFRIREEPYQDAGSGSAPITGAGAATKFTEIFHISSWGKDALTANLNLLLSENKGRVLSRPKLVCLSGKEASFLVGGQIPIVTEQTGTGGSEVSVEYKDYGILLKIVPIVKAGMIDTTIETEVSSVDWANAVTASGISVPAFATRSTATQVYLRDNQTIFIAGLIKNNETDNVNKVPALASVPILGALFRSKDFQDARTELVISLTPRIIRSEVEVPVADIKKDYKTTTRSGGAGYVKVEDKPSARITKENIPYSLYAYIKTVQSKIAQAVQYPDEARQFGWEGSCILRLHLFSDGSLDKALIRESSGYSLFDKAAIKAANLQVPYPPFPSETKKEDLWIDIPIVYNLE